LAGKDQDTFFNRLNIYTKKINNNASFSHKFRYEDLEFKLKIKMLQLQNKFDDKGQIIIKHEIIFYISKVIVNIAPYYLTENRDIVEKVLKHTTKTKFVIERVYLDENLYYKPMYPSQFYTCVKPKAEDYIKNPFRWLYILAMSNEK
jgi:hypothetical protein